MARDWFRFTKVVMVMSESSLFSGMALQPSGQVRQLGEI
jgi:hypothetical protein